MSASFEVDSDGVGRLRLQRPESANGLDMAMLEALHARLLEAHGDSRLRALLLSGEGRHFCAGGDVHAFHAMGEALPGYIRRATALLGEVATLLVRLPAPVVCAVQGYAAGGGGIGLVCASDLVLAARSAKFLAGMTRVAMVPDAGASVTLARLVGFRKAMEILLTNPTLDADEAKAIGLVTRVVDEAALEAEAIALCRRLAAGAPAAQAETKRLLWSGLSRSVEAAIPDENRTQATLAGTADALEGLLAVIEKRSPRFTGR